MKKYRLLFLNNGICPGTFELPKCNLKKAKEYVETYKGNKNVKGCTIEIVSIEHIFKP